jgi:hypothetical protein
MIFQPAPSRRNVLTGLGGAVVCLGASLSARGTTFDSRRLGIEARSATLPVSPGQPPLSIWELAPEAGSDIRLRQGTRLELAFRNGLSLPVSTVWQGLEGAPAAQPLFRPLTASGSVENSTLSMLHAGTLMLDLRLFEAGLSGPARPLPLIVLESEQVAVDRDDLLLIEEWRLTRNGVAAGPGAEAVGADPIFTINGRTSFELQARPSQRLRLRFINGSQRTVVAIKLEAHDLRVMAIDGEPAEPFSARNGAIVLPPGGRADVFVDSRTSAAFLLHDGRQAHELGRLIVSGEMARSAPLTPAPPLPSNGLPAALELKRAERFDMVLGGPENGWVKPVEFSPKSAPAFSSKQGRTIVLALRNPAPVTAIFNLPGHHFRLLDRLDDGWKPYWLNTIAVEPGQTERIAFATPSPGSWLIEMVRTEWAAPRLVRWFAIS